MLMVYHVESFPWNLAGDHKKGKNRLDESKEASERSKSVVCNTYLENTHPFILVGAGVPECHGAYLALFHAESVEG